MINKLGPIHSDGRKRRMDAIYARNAAQNRVAKDVKYNERLGNVTYNDKQKFNDGFKWFESGLSIDDAVEKLRKNPNFKAGFDCAERRQNAKQESYKTGLEWFEKGVKLEEIPDMYKNNEYFMNGYNEASKKKRK